MSITWSFYWLLDFCGCIGWWLKAIVLAECPHEFSELKEVYGCLILAQCAHWDVHVVLDGLFQVNSLSGCFAFHHFSWFIVDFEWLLFVNWRTITKLFSEDGTVIAKIVSNILDGPSVLEWVLFGIRMLSSLHIKSQRSSKATESMVNSLRLVDLFVLSLLVAKEASWRSYLFGDEFFHLILCRSIFEGECVSKIVGAWLQFSKSVDSISISSFSRSLCEEKEFAVTQRSDVAHLLQ